MDNNEIEEHSSFPFNPSLNPDRISTKKYDYDKKFNWIKMITVTEWKETFITKRYITYF